VKTDICNSTLQPTPKVSSAFCRPGRPALAWINSPMMKLKLMDISSSRT
jgi:hypothetical protein